MGGWELLGFWAVTKGVLWSLGYYLNSGSCGNGMGTVQCIILIYGSLVHGMCRVGDVA